MTKQLFLPLKKEWYDKIKSGAKTTEYRLAKPYWVDRLLVSSCAYIKKKHLDASDVYTSVRFACGYSKTQTAFEIKHISRVPGIDTDLAIDADVFAIELGDKIF